MVLKINKKFQKLYTTKKRYIVVTGGRGSGKTFAVKDFLLRLLEEVGQGILYTRYTMVSVETSIIPLFTKHIEQYADIKNYKVTKTKIINLSTGSFILFSGIKTSSGDQTGRLKTLPDITTWVVEEGEDFNNEQAFDDIDDSIRSLTTQNRIIWIQNPSTREHFIYKKFFSKTQRQKAVLEAGTYYCNDTGKQKQFYYQSSTHENVEHIHTTYYDNFKNLNPTKLKLWEEAKVKNPKRWVHKYGGAWLDKAEGVIFTNWTEGAFNNNLPYAYGQDYGYTSDPTTLIKCAVDEKQKKVYLHECFYLTDINGKELSTDDIHSLNSSYIDEMSALIVADSAEGRLIGDLYKKGLNIIECEKGAGSVNAGIKALQGYELIITPESKNIRTELNNYVWNNKKAGIPIDDYNHAIDAIRYVFRELTGSSFNPYTAWSA